MAVKDNRAMKHSNACWDMINYSKNLTEKTNINSKIV